ncbi:hypothetical protein [Fibrella forsythiae]|nr:hypothetical protein [Fibrella forsythiae]
MPVSERMAKARAAKQAKKSAANHAQLTADQPGTGVKIQKATPADYQTPIDKLKKGPNGEAVHIGERGGKYYINKNGNKTYLSSNQ